MQTISPDIQMPPGLKLLKPTLFPDDRGYFTELSTEKWLRNHGIEHPFIQDNLSWSKANVVRGLHFQEPPFAQAKLVTVISGEVLDVVVDLRVGSPTYGKTYSVLLSSETHHSLYVPVGFAHGISVLSPNGAHFYYKCSAYYNKQSEMGINVADPDLNIDWRVAQPILSEKDKTYPRLAEYQSPFLFEPSV